MDLKVYGAFRSGTNYVKTLVELNYDARVLNSGGGFKHAPIPAILGEDGWSPPPMPTLGVVKDPWSWLPSMWRYVQGRGADHTVCGETWGSFLMSPLVVFDGSRNGFPRFWFRTPVDSWIAMADSLHTSATHLIRYEDVLRHPEITCRRIAAAIELDRTYGTFEVPTTKTRNMADRDRAHMHDYVADEEFDPHYYTQRRFLNTYTRDEAAVVRNLLRVDIVARLGYSASPVPESA